MYISSCLFSLRWSGLLVTPRCILSVSLALSYLDVWLKTIIWVYILVCVFLFLPAVCTVTTISQKPKNKPLHHTILRFKIFCKCINIQYAHIDMDSSNVWMTLHYTFFFLDLHPLLFISFTQLLLIKMVFLVIFSWCMKSFLIKF